MKYYVIINGESSLNIQGLAIQSLPPISKPLMRSRQETIDGRDGDVITKLGYAAYDKTLKIGLWGNYDINEVITFFNQEGEIVFSSEPDKYYRFTILNRDDYINQLEVFRTATIILHCQPYKYLLNEEPKEMENEYITITDVSSATFNNTLETPMNIDLKGNTLQNGTPTPSSPIPVNNISGDNDIVVNTKNFFNVNGYKEKPNSITISDNKIIMENAAYTPIVYVIKVNNNTTYNISCNSLNTNIYRLQVKASDSSGTAGTTIVNGSIYALSYSESFITTSEYIRIEIFQSTSTSRQEVSNIQLELGNQATPYEEYNGTTYNIDLPVENLFDKTIASKRNSNASNSQISNGIKISPTGNNGWCLWLIKDVSNDVGKKFSTRATFNGGKIAFVLCDANGYNLTTGVDTSSSDTNLTYTIPTLSSATYLAIQLYGNSNNTNEVNFTNIMVNEGATANQYTPYGTTPIELNKIGTYEDKPFKAINGDKFYDSLDNATKQTLTYGKWYLHKEIGKKVFNGTENYWRIGVQDNNNILYTSNTGVEMIDALSENSPILTNYFEYKGMRAGTTSALESGIGSYTVKYIDTGKIAIYFVISKTEATDINNWKTWLSTHNVIVNYVLATPINIEITYQPLINQLNAIFEAQSKNGTTNVNQVNNDAPFMLDLSVLGGSDTLTINNIGNAPSKPVITLVGSGNVGLYLNDIQVFQISLGTNETIILDTENMEAYYGSQLKNRQVIGDYNSFALQSGENTIRFTGSVSYIEITNYTRWI